MKIQVSKVFAAFVNETAKERGVSLEASIRKRQLRPYENLCDQDYNWDTNEVREMVISYPAEYYACERVVRTDELVAEFNWRHVKTWEQLKDMVIDMFQI